MSVFSEQQKMSVFSEQQKMSNTQLQHTGKNVTSLFNVEAYYQNFLTRYNEENILNKGLQVPNKGLQVPSIT